MTCAVYLRDLIVFTLIFHIVAVNHYKSVKSIDNNLYKKIMDAKSKQSYPLYIWRLQHWIQNQRQTEYCYFSNSEKNYCKHCSCASNNRYHSKDMTSRRQINVVSISHQYRRMFAGNSTNEAALKINKSAS